MKAKILFLVQLPPPIHGASAVNKSIQLSPLINEKYATEFVNISPASDLADIGKPSFNKIIKLFVIFSRSIFAFLKFKPDLVYITLSPHGLAFYKDGLLALILKALGGKLVFHLHGKGINKESTNSRFKRVIYTKVFKRVSIIHLSDRLFSDVDGIRDPQMPIISIPNGIEAPEFPSNIPQKNIITFVYLSNLIRAKGADILIRAVELIDDRYSNLFQVKIIGKESTSAYAEELKTLLTPNLARRIEILGPKYGKDKIYELCSSDVFVLPTKNDCFPLTILEAMATGLAVISTNEGAIAEIVDHGVTGDILHETSPEALAEAMMKYIESPDYAKQCAKNGRDKFTKLYTTEHFEKKLCASFDNFLNSK
ncbi:glycosyltransferase family 4 protein [Pseudomonas sp. Y24-6]|uniref:glycosyltransferase family 4 protein n=1 Tax=Pseudomonas sp. Y24-6 TaxID=2750013 RepID=UPI001CE10EDD|nr:glycosyltransferase family 4 protein [Pseudomonas sp. Y24-6]MCA4962036.1 glycosyltransferase family 4 protein [Pseudomonas sp. Y24-6]